MQSGSGQPRGAADRTGASEPQREKESELVSRVKQRLGKYPTVIHYIYEEIFKGTKKFHNTALLDEITEKVIKKIVLSGMSAIPSFNEELRNKGFEYKPGSFDCDDYSFMLLGTGRRIGIPLELILASRNHTIIRYDSDREHDALNQMKTINQEDHIIDVTDFKNNTIVMSRKDEFYRKLFNISNESIENRINLTNLSDIKIIGFAHYLKARFYKDTESSIKELDKAIELFPNLSYAYNGKANSLFKIGHSQKKPEYLERAMRDVEKAIRLDPNFAEAHYTGGLIKYWFGNYSESEKFCENALEVISPYSKYKKPKFVEQIENLRISAKQAFEKKEKSKKNLARIEKFSKR